MSPKNSPPDWYHVALGELGVHETKGPESTKRIIEYHSMTSLKAKDDLIPWCSAFVCWCLESVGIESTRAPNARSYLTYGRPVAEPYEGCIVVLKRGESWQGHVGFFVKKSLGFIWVLGGNQSDEVCIQKFWGGRLLGYREPGV
jgi:uncharacterized protein (TIGR02594 family)